MPGLDAAGSAWPVYVGAVVDAYDVDNPSGLVNPIDHPVSAAPRGVVSGQLASQWLAYPVWAVE